MRFPIVDRVLAPLRDPALAFTPPRDLIRALRSARLRVLPEKYAALARVTAANAGAALALVTLLLALVQGTRALAAVALAGAAGAGAFALVHAGFLAFPRVTAASRARRIDAEYPGVVVLCYALARGGLDTISVFRAVAEERDTYGEISDEFGLVVRSVDVLGEDVTTALERAAALTPSRTLRGFFEGLLTIIGSGAHPRDFFKRQAETQLEEAEAHLEREIDQAGMLAEVYVSGLLVLPLLLIVILALMGGIGGGSAHATLIPLVVFVLIPVGTVAYLVLVEMLLPPEKLEVPTLRDGPLTDFGYDFAPTHVPALPRPTGATVDDVREDVASGGARSLRRRLAVEWARRRAVTAWKRFVVRAVEKPVDAIEVSGVLGLTVLLVGGLVMWLTGTTGADLVVGLTSLTLVAGLVAAVPVSAFHEVRVQRARNVDARLPAMLHKLRGFNERGIDLLRAFDILGRSSTNALAQDLRRVARDVEWTGNLAAALRRMRERVRTRRMMVLGVLFERASAATGNLKDVLEIAARDAARTENLRSRKRQAMTSYVVVIYLVFAVFLYVVFTVTDLFYGAGAVGATAAAVGDTPLAGGGATSGLAPGEARVLFFHAVLIQAAMSGVVAGRLGEGHLLSGLKHAAVLGIVAWLVFRMGVMG